MLGLFDSGVGGLSVWRELPDSLAILYFADTAHAPYGGLGRDKLFIYAKESIDHLIEMGATSIAIACHTVATTVTSIIRPACPIPVLDIATHSLPLLNPFTRIGILGTQATIASRFYQKRLGPVIASAIACPLLAPMIERGVIDQAVIKESLAPLDRNIDALFLACTHFPLIREALAQELPGIPLIDPAPSFAQILSQLAEPGKTEFYTTGDPTQFHRCANIFSGPKKVSSPYLAKSLYLFLHS